MGPSTLPLSRSKPPLIDFDRDIREFVLANLPHQPEARAELESQSTSSMLVTYFNWYCRLIPTQRRRVHKSSELKRKMTDLPTSQRRAIGKIEDDISRGRDLTPHLSRAIQHGYVAHKQAPKKTKGRKDRDLMLYDWGLHHLHLSDRVDADGFVIRSETLLFAGFLASDAYLIDVAPHGSWYLRSMLEAIVLNWPDSGLLLPSMSDIRLSRTLSEDEGQELREAGVSVNFFESQNKVWAPRDFISTAGTSLRATRRADFILNEADRLEALLQSEPAPLIAEIEDAAGSLPEPRLKFLIDGHRYGILEESSRTFLVVGKLAE